MNSATKYLPARGDRRRHYIQTKRIMSTVIDLEQEIVRENTATLAQEFTHLEAQAKLDNEVAKVQAKVASAYKAGIMDELGFDYQTAEARRIRQERDDFAALPQNRIMSTDAIKAVCIKYGLRFLPTRFYKGALDGGIGPAVENVKSLLGGKLPIVEHEFIECRDISPPRSSQGPRFSIAAPSESFQLTPMPRDPLLFLRLSLSKWFLVHKWGDDLRTGDVRKGEIGEHNWNSQFSTTIGTPPWDRQSLADMIFNTGTTMNMSIGQQNQSLASMPTNWLRGR